MERLTKEQLQERREKALRYCNNCVKLKDGECTVLKELFHVWSNEKECWAKETDPVEYRKALEQIEEYSGGGDGVNTLSYSMKSEIRRIDSLIEQYKYQGWEEVYHEEVHRKNIKKGGGGEKADRTNKMFGPQQMKDNKFAHRRNNPIKWSDWY